MMDNFLISDGLLTPEIVKSLPSLVCEGQSRLVRQGGLAGDSPSHASFTSQVYDAFTYNRGQSPIISLCTYHESGHRYRYALSGEG